MKEIKQMKTDGVDTKIGHLWSQKLKQMRCCNIMERYWNLKRYEYNKYNAKEAGDDSKDKNREKIWWKQISW